ncbi:unnamed protein product [Closterium sp. NIES-65]|nr:unnamed protein product [Closterium sp. NIES-65]
MPVTIGHALPSGNPATPQLAAALEANEELPPAGLSTNPSPSSESGSARSFKPVRTKEPRKSSSSGASSSSRASRASQPGSLRVPKSPRSNTSSSSPDQPTTTNAVDQSSTREQSARASGSQSGGSRRSRHKANSSADSLSSASAVTTASDDGAGDAAELAAAPAEPPSTAATSAPSASTRKSAAARKERAAPPEGDEEGGNEGEGEEAGAGEREGEGEEEEEEDEAPALQRVQRSTTAPHYERVKGAAGADEPRPMRVSTSYDARGKRGLLLSPNTHRVVSFASDLKLPEGFEGEDAEAFSRNSTGGLMGYQQVGGLPRPLSAPSLMAQLNSMLTPSRSVGSFTESVGVSGIAVYVGPKSVLSPIMPAMPRHSFPPCHLPVPPLHATSPCHLFMPPPRATSPCQLPPPLATLTHTSFPSFPPFPHSVERPNDSLSSSYAFPLFVPLHPSFLFPLMSLLFMSPSSCLPPRSIPSNASKFSCLLRSVPPSCSPPHALPLMTFPFIPPPSCLPQYYFPPLMSFPTHTSPSATSPPPHVMPPPVRPPLPLMPPPVLPSSPPMQLLRATKALLMEILFLLSCYPQSLLMKIPFFPLIPPHRVFPPPPGFLPPPHPPQMQLLRVTRALLMKIPFFPPHTSPSYPPRSCLPRFYLPQMQLFRVTRALLMKIPFFRKQLETTAPDGKLQTPEHASEDEELSFMLDCDEATFSRVLTVVQYHRYGAVLTVVQYHRYGAVLTVVQYHRYGAVLTVVQYHRYSAVLTVVQYHRYGAVLTVVQYHRYGAVLTVVQYHRYGAVLTVVQYHSLEALPWMNDEDFYRLRSELDFLGITLPPGSPWHHLPWKDERKAAAASAAAAAAAAASGILNPAAAALAAGYTSSSDTDEIREVRGGAATAGGMAGGLAGMMGAMVGGGMGVGGGVGGMGGAGAGAGMGGGAGVGGKGFGTGRASLISARSMVRRSVVVGGAGHETPPGVGGAAGGGAGAGGAKSLVEEDRLDVVYRHGSDTAAACTCFGTKEADGHSHWVVSLFHGHVFCAFCGRAPAWHPKLFAEVFLLAALPPAPTQRGANAFVGGWYYHGRSSTRLVKLHCVAGASCTACRASIWGVSIEHKHAFCLQCKATPTKPAIIAKLFVEALCQPK